MISVHSLSSEWNRTSSPADMATSFGHVAVLLVSTIPKVGLSARDAMPVLNDIDVMSQMAVPVVSEPVPAVVGTQTRGLSFFSIGLPLPIGALINSMRSASG